MSEARSKDLTAAVIVIGDELLKGHVRDANSHYLCKELWELGVKVGKVVVVADYEDAIVTEVRALSPLYDYVLTTGGVGPTHDDITVEAVGKAFSEDLAPHPDVLKFLFPKDPSNPSNRTHPWWKMVLLPTSAKVYIPKHEEGAFAFLLIIIHNVHCYPGVPSLLRNLFPRCKDLYGGSGKFFLKEVFFSCEEDTLATPLTVLQREFPTVQVGSYPDYSEVNSYSVRVALESRDLELVEKAYGKLVLSLPISTMMSARCSYEGKAMEAREHVAEALGLSPNKASLLPNSLCSRLQDSMKVLERAMDEYGLAGTCVAFNGGKDCTVILALLRAILTRRGDMGKISVLYVAEGKQFPEVEEFFHSTVKRLGLDVVQIPGNIRQALSELKTCRPELKAVCMGTRRTDPHSADLEAFSVTDDSWPEYMRVNSILEWTYGEIWLFLRLCDIPYCKLYDRGYSSLDGMEDTHPNPSLLMTTESPLSANPTSSPDDSYLPAYMLEDEALERMGRTNHRSANL